MSTFQYNCGSKTNYNSTYFMNNNYPQTFNTIGQCSISIEKVRTRIDDWRMMISCWPGQYGRVSAQTGLRGDGALPARPGHPPVHLGQVGQDNHNQKCHVQSGLW